MNNSIFKLDLPYPEIQSTKANIHDVRCIKNDFAGTASECSAVMQYLYQHLISDPICPKVAKALEGIAIVEMHHFGLLGEAITKMGGDPIVGGTHQFWNGSFVNYTKNIKQFLMINIKGEEEAIANYKKTIECASDPDLKALISRIILDEELHIKIFKELLTYSCAK